MARLFKRIWLGVLGFASLALIGCATTQSAPSQPPNILLIVADDIGFTDLGAYGSEIHTPVLDALARDGVMFSNFYTSFTCSPTRAALLTGVAAHKAGLGNMFEDLAPNQKGQPGYEGYLNFDVVSIASLFQRAGYDTYMSGKWHLGLEDYNAPSRRGFDSTFVTLQGGAGHFANRVPILGDKPALYRANGRLFDDLPDDFYSTAFFADWIIEHVSDSLDAGRPFFAYLAYTAPHWPLQAPRESIARYDGVYDDGYEALYEARLAAAIERGLVPETAQGSDIYPGQRPWSELSLAERAYEAKRMQVFAAMVSDIDHHTGRVLDTLRDAGALDSTVVVFLSDNGAEGHEFTTEWVELAEHASRYDNAYDNLGAEDSYIWLGPNWARASTAPFRLFKGYPTEGGIRAPLIISYPGLGRSGALATAAVRAIDITPTLLDIAGLNGPDQEFEGRAVHPMTGRSLVPYARGETDGPYGSQAVLADEVFGKRYVRRGPWKAVLAPPPHGAGDWQLYNLDTDISERDDLAQQHPELLAELVDAWDAYARENRIILPNWVSGY